MLQVGSEEKCFFLTNLAQGQWYRSKSITWGALLITKGFSFPACIFIRNFEVNSSYLYKKMIMSSSRQRSLPA